MQGKKLKEIVRALKEKEEKREEEIRGKELLVERVRMEEQVKREFWSR